MLVFLSELILFIGIVSIFNIYLFGSKEMIVMDMIDFKDLGFEENFYDMKKETRVDPESKTIYKKYIYSFKPGVLNKDMCLEIGCQNIIGLVEDDNEIFDINIKDLSETGDFEYDGVNYTQEILDNNNGLGVTTNGFDDTGDFQVPEQINHIGEYLIINFPELIINDYETSKVIFAVSNMFFNETSPLGTHHERGVYKTYIDGTLINEEIFQPDIYYAGGKFEVEIKKGNFNKIIFYGLNYEGISPDIKIDGGDFFVSYMKIIRLDIDKTPEIYSNCFGKSLLCSNIKRFDLINNEIEIEFVNNYNITK